MNLDKISLPDRPSFGVRPDQLDSVLGPVLLPKQLTVVHSSNRAALTTLAHTLAVCAADSGSASVFLDSGNNYSPQLVRTLCSSSPEPDSTISRISIARVLSFSDFDEIIGGLKRMGSLSLVTIDSLTALLNLSAPPGSVGRQRSLYRILENLRGLANEHALHVMMTDCSARQWTTGESVPIGGNVLSHSVDAVLRIDTLDLPQVTVRIEVERGGSSANRGGVILRLTKNGLEAI